MGKIDSVYIQIETYCSKDSGGVNAQLLASMTGMDRSTVSRYLNQLHKAGRVEKIDGRPVLFKPIDLGVTTGGQQNPEVQEARGAANRGKHGLQGQLDQHGQHAIDRIIGAESSLQVAVQQAKAAILYPPRGLHTLILGETGVGKSMFAELMYGFAKESGMIASEAPFVKFNCADYADNPQLLVAQIFGVRKGAYTGADKDRDGLLKRADGGILFLDEVHRLSPQGQEMLFTFIDKGHFRMLGDADHMQVSNVQIIAATTEDPSSFLLRTFTRRIPMSITLASLRERTLKERYDLIKNFIREESKRIGKNVYVNRNALMALLLYECQNNIGQLRSDIQLACAKAFLIYKSKNKNYIMVNNADLPNHVRKGSMMMKERRDELDGLLKSKDDILRFGWEEGEPESAVPQEKETTYFYNVIENKVEDLRNSGVEDDEIKSILNIDIEKHFHEYIGDLPDRFRRDEVQKVVDVEVLDMVDRILSFAGDKLAKTYDEKIYFGLALHLHSSIERMKSGGRIYHPRLNFVRVTYNREFMVAMEVARMIDEAFKLEVSLDEIGYLTMFLASNPYDLDEEDGATVGILVMMHGNSTATSMAQVANSLVGTEHVKALDMPLSMKAMDMYEVAREEVRKLDKGKGVLLLVDMGSLVNFGDMIHDETKIMVKTIDLVSTPIVIEACRKAVMGRDLFELYRSCINDRRLATGSASETEELDGPRTSLIVTACFTGEGASDRLKKMIEADLIEKGNHTIAVKALSILNKAEFRKNLVRMSDNYDVLALVGTVDVASEGIPFISAVDYLAGKGRETLSELVEDDLSFKNIGLSLKEHINSCEADELAAQSRSCLKALVTELGLDIPKEVFTGILLHLCFMMDRKLKGEPSVVFQEIESFKMNRGPLLATVKRHLCELEMRFKAVVDEHDAAHVARMLVENSQ